VDLLIFSLNEQTDAFGMLSNRCSFLYELGRDTVSIDDMCIATEKLAVVYSNNIEEHSFGSQLLQFSNFVKLFVDKKQGKTRR